MKVIPHNRLAELVNEPWTLPAPNSSPVGDSAAQIFHEAGIPLPAITMFSSAGVARAALVAKGRFLTMTVESVFRFAGRDMGIKPLPVEMPYKARPVAIITLKNRMLTPAARLFIDTAREVAKPFATRRSDFSAGGNVQRGAVWRRAARSIQRMSEIVKVFGRPARELGLRAGVAGVGKPPREETARGLGLGGGARRLWGFECYAPDDLTMCARRRKRMQD
jgi:hypothetical protein